MNKKIFSVLYALSFLCILPLYYASPYISAQTWADAVALISAVCAVYAFLYIVWLRKKDNVSLGRAVARYFLYFNFMVLIGLLLHYCGLFFNGFTATDVMGNAVSDRKYGFAAIAEDGWGNMVYVPLLIFCVIYQAGYYYISCNISENKEK